MTQRILLIEDDEELGRQIVGHLEAQRLEVTWVKDGAEAKTLAPDAFALLILDLMLPGAFGLDVLQHVRTESDGLAPLASQASALSSSTANSTGSVRGL